ncbi:MAG: EF-hand domain-containing protein [Sphingomonadaceae bacterium]
MTRYLAGAAAAVLLATAGFFLWTAQADKPVGQAALIPPPPAQAADAPLGVADLAPPPAASERTREEKRFARYDKDKNGAVGRGEYLASRQKAFARLDTDGDGRVSFEEYAVKASTKFVSADKDRNGGLSATEFATTRVVRKNRPQPNCPPTMQRAPDPTEGEES